LTSFRSLLQVSQLHLIDRIERTMPWETTGDAVRAVLSECAMSVRATTEMSDFAVRAAQVIPADRNADSRRLKNGETCMFRSRSRKKQKPSLLKRLFYLLAFFCGSGAGLGGWAFKDHPRAQALWTLVTGKPAAAEDARADALGLEGSLVREVTEALEPHADFCTTGVYQVTIRKVELDPALFQRGHTADIQAKVHALDAHGRDTTLWDSRSYGERLAVVGRDELSAGWPNRPFQVEWKPGEQLVLEVYDRKTALFMPPKSFTLAASDRAVSEFPLKTGDFTLQPVGKVDASADRCKNHAVLRSQRQGDSGQHEPAQVATRPMVIR
jgi:hypothetical protein